MTARCSPTLAVTEMEATITGLSQDDSLVILQTKFVDIQTGATGPLPWNVEFHAFPIGHRMLLPSGHFGIMTFDPAFVFRGSGVVSRPLVDTWTAHPPRNGFILTFRPTPGKAQIVEASINGIRWIALPEDQAIFYGSTNDRAQYFIPRLNHARRYYRVREREPE